MSERAYFITIHELTAEEIAEFENLARIGNMRYHIGRYRRSRQPETGPCQQQSIEDS